MKIYTHGGAPHADEVVAIGILILAVARKQGKTVKETSFQVIRVSSDRELPQELGTSEYVVDIGQRYDPGNNWFDHHVPIKEIAEECSATLVAKALLPELLADSKWRKGLDRIRIGDTSGREGITEAFGIDFSDRQPFVFIEDGLVSLFADEPEAVSRMFAQMIEKRFRAQADKQRAYEWISDEENYTIEHTKNRVVLVLENDPRASGVDLTALEAAQQRLLSKHGVHAVYGFHSRSENARALYRTGTGTAGLDFTKSKPVNPIFTHQGGFLVVFEPSNDVEWRHLLGQAILPGVE